MNGKNKCRILKEIRTRIARDNDIPYITSECKFQGECTGTCPKCEAELRYLEQELVKRQRAGKAVAVAGVALALTLGTVGCGTDPDTLVGDVAIVEPTDTQTLEGNVTIEESACEQPLEGEVAEPTQTETVETEELLGDVAYVE